MAIVEITDAAREHIKATLARTGTSVLEIGVSGKGCNGMSYTFTPTSTTDLRGIDEKMDLGDGFMVVIPGECVMYLLGSRIDHEDTVFSSRLVVTNPMAASTCGCGTSFAPDFSKIDQGCEGRA